MGSNPIVGSQVMNSSSYCGNELGILAPSRFRRVDFVLPHLLYCYIVAVNLIHNGTDDIRLRTILGHTSQVMIRRYVKLASKDIMAASACHATFGFWKFNL